MKTLMLIIGIFIPFIYACHSDNDPPESLSHSPTGEVIVKVAGTAIAVDFSLDVDIKNNMELSFNPDVKTREGLISYYKTLPPSFGSSFSSMSNIEDYHFAKVEYWIAQECFQSDCSSETRRDVLTMAVEKQKKKFDVSITGPPFYMESRYSRRTGAFLIALILLKEGDNSFIQSLTSDVDMQKTLLCLNKNMWIDKEQSKKLVQYAENFLSSH